MLSHLSGSLFESLANSPAFDGLKQIREHIRTTAKSIESPESDSFSVAAEVKKSLEKMIALLQEELKKPEQAKEHYGAIALGDLKKLQRMLIPLSEGVINLTPDWKKAKYKDLVREVAGPDWFEISALERRTRANYLGAEISDQHEDFEVTGAVFEKLIEPTLINPDIRDASAWAKNLSHVLAKLSAR